MSNIKISDNNKILEVNNTKLTFNWESNKHVFGENVISWPTIRIAHELGSKFLTKSDYHKSTVSQQIETLKAANQRLQKAEDCKIRDRGYALFRAALSVAIVAAGVFGVMATMALPPLAIGIAITAFVAACLLGTYNAHRAEIDLKKWKFAMPVAAVIGGPVFALDECFNKVSRLKKEVIGQQKAFEADSEEFKVFLGIHHEWLTTQLNAKIASSKDDGEKIRYENALTEITNLKHLKISKDHLMGN